MVGHQIIYPSIKGIREFATEGMTWIESFLGRFQGGGTVISG